MIGFFEILTLIFVFFKVFGVISWSWWLVFLPTILSTAFWITIILISELDKHETERQIRNFIKKDHQ